MKKIIGLVGFIGSGKGTIGDYLESKYGYQKMSFASSLKDAVSSIFAWPRHLLEGDTPESRKWREIEDPYWSSKMGGSITPRWILQHFGTNILREKFFEDIWICSLEKKLIEIDGPLVITDVRFPNEIRMIAEQGGDLIWVRRNPEPSWLDIALTDKSAMLVRSDVHPSEYEWIGEHNFKVIWNDSTLDALKDKVDAVVSGL